MERFTHKKREVIIIAVAVVLVASAGTVALMQALRPNEQDPFKQTAITNSTDSSESRPQEEVQEPLDTSADENNSQPTNDQDQDVEVDPATVATVDIEPMELTVSYVKGVGGFEYEVMRTANGTNYVEFRSQEVIGTKCTDDKGPFASILANPQSNEAATLTKQTTVNGEEYGLSLASKNCTNDIEKLEAYQKSFSDAFGLLKALD